jgi:hypothetical protein
MMSGGRLPEMDIGRALTYVFDDPEWFGKLALTAIIVIASVVFTPLLIGLVGWAVLLGYIVELVRNVRLGVKYPLPRWTDFNRYLSVGFNALTAVIVYSLPNLVLGCASSIMAQNMGSGLIGSTLVLALSCCLFPILLVYNLVAVPMLALGIGRYVEDPRINVFFELSLLFDLLRQHTDTVIQWWLAAIVVDIVFVVLGIIPVLGWLVLAALIVPVFGMLTGQFALTILGGLKGKPKNAAQVYRR